MLKVTTTVQIKVEGRPDLTEFTAFCTVVNDRVQVFDLPHILNAYETYLKDVDKQCSEKFMKICKTQIGENNHGNTDSN